MDEKGFRLNVADAMRAEGLSWRRMAQETGLSERTFQNWRDGRTHIRLEQALVIARRLHVSIDRACGLGPFPPDPSLARIERSMRLLPAPIRESVAAMVEAIASQEHGRDRTDPFEND